MYLYKVSEVGGQYEEVRRGGQLRVRRPQRRVDGQRRGPQRVVALLRQHVPRQPRQPVAAHAAAQHDCLINK